MIISRTPYRISFFGGGTDYPRWYRQNGGEVLATTIDKYCYITCRYLPPFFEHRFRVVYSKIENCVSVDQIEHPAARETLRFLDFDRGVEIHHDGDLPARSGMGTSSSYTVGLLHALYALKGQMPEKRKLANESIHIEQERLQETVGCQDQVMASFGGLNHVTFPEEGEISVKPLTLPTSRISELDDHLVLCYTGIQRTASSIAGDYVNDIASKESLLRSLQDMVKEGISILSNDQPIEQFGRLLNEAWKSKRQMGSNVTNPMVDQVYATALDNGAIGGKLLGAGGGGFMLLFVPPDEQQRLKEKLDGFIFVPFKFETSGTQIIFYEQQEDFSNADQARIGQSAPVFQELSNNS